MDLWICRIIDWISTITDWISTTRGTQNVVSFALVPFRLSLGRGLKLFERYISQTGYPCFPGYYCQATVGNFDVSPKYGYDSGPPDLRISSVSNSPGVCMVRSGGVFTKRCCFHLGCHFPHRSSPATTA